MFTASLWYAQRCVHLDGASALKNFFGGGQLPFSGREINGAAPFVQMQDRRHEEPAAEHILLLRLPAFFISRKIIEHGAQKRRTVPVSLLIQFFDIVVYGDADAIIFFLAHVPHMLVSRLS